MQQFALDGGSVSEFGQRGCIIAACDNSHWVSISVQELDNVSLPSDMQQRTLQTCRRMESRLGLVASMSPDALEHRVFLKEKE